LTFKHLFTVKIQKHFEVKKIGLQCFVS